MAWRERVIDRSNHLLSREQNGEDVVVEKAYAMAERRRRAMGVLTAKYRYLSWSVISIQNHGHR